MIRIFAALSVPLLAASFAFLAPAAGPDTEGVERAVQDYVEGLYQVKPELIERSVHPALVKLGTYRPESETEYRTPSRMTYEQLHELAGHWNKDGAKGDDLKFEIRVLEVLDQTASAALTADWGVDHMQLVRQGERWKIVHVLWQSHPPTE